MQRNFVPVSQSMVTPPDRTPRNAPRPALATVAFVPRIQTSGTHDRYVGGKESET